MRRSSGTQGRGRWASAHTAERQPRRNRPCRFRLDRYVTRRHSGRRQRRCPQEMHGRLDSAFAGNAITMGSGPQLWARTRPIRSSGRHVSSPRWPHQFLGPVHRNHQNPIGTVSFLLTRGKHRSHTPCTTASPNQVPVATASLRKFGHLKDHDIAACRSSPK